MNHKNAVLEGLERMRQFDKHGDGVAYVYDDKEYTTNQLIEEIKNDTEVGRKFSDNVYDTILTYMAKFSQDAN